MRNDKENLIVQLSFELALEIISFSEEIRNSNRFEMSTQIFKSGTSIGTNIREAQNAESKSDFIHKFKIAAKEIDELIYWLELCQNSEFYPNPNQSLIQKCQTVQKVVSKIISSTKKQSFSN